MQGSGPKWRVRLRKGDKLRVSSTYETRRASWYESMGIMLTYVAWSGRGGRDPFHSKLDKRGYVTHGQLPENTNYGGPDAPGVNDPSKLPNGQTLGNGVAIEGFTYTPGNLGLAGPLGNPPVVAQGDALRFGNFDSAAQIYHTITACKSPCNGATGVSYPLANGPIRFDSGNLGEGPAGFTAAAGRSDWYTPKSLPTGTYTYFCRVHPFMRGSFRVIPKSGK
jgi:plastocyanin